MTYIIGPGDTIHIGPSDYGGHIIGPSDYVGYIIEPSDYAWFVGKFCQNNGEGERAQ